MTETLLALVPQYGMWLLAAATFTSCLALPIPASILMMAAGGFIASGDLSLAQSVTAALAGAVLGDQIGYVAGHRGGSRLMARMQKRAEPLTKATDLLARRGGVAVFLSRWLFSPLGPYVNLAAGAARQPWGHFFAWGIAGESVWVGLYIGLGYAFTGDLEAASGMAFELLGFVAAGAVAVGLAVWLAMVLRAERRASAQRGIVIAPEGSPAQPDAPVTAMD